MKQARIITAEQRRQMVTSLTLARVSASMVESRLRSIARSLGCAEDDELLLDAVWDHPSKHSPGRDVDRMLGAFGVVVTDQRIAPEVTSGVLERRCDLLRRLLGGGPSE